MNFPDLNNPAVIAVDFQERLMPVISGNENIINRASILLQGARELGVRTLVSEQYPKGLGSTIPEISACLTPDAPVIAKHSFSVFGESAFRSALLEKRPGSLIICGVETHVCVLQSVFDALEAGFQVVLVSDAVGSRKEADKQLALEAARQAGAWVMSTEALLFMLLRDAAHPSFKAVSKLIK